MVDVVVEGRGYVNAIIVVYHGVVINIVLIRCHNDAIVTVYDDLANTAGTEAIPTQTFDASALGLNGVVFAHPIECQVGIYVEIGDLGTGEVLIYFN